MHPAAMPQSSAARQASSGFAPAPIMAAATHPPSGKLPSTVRSATSRIRNVM